MTISERRSRDEDLSHDLDPIPPAALAAATFNPALQIWMGDKLGSLEVGKFADIIVIDRNLFEIDATDISEAKVEMTMMDGEVRYRDGL